jgi:hypothetical protein
MLTATSSTSSAGSVVVLQIAHQFEREAATMPATLPALAAAERTTTSPQSRPRQRRGGYHARPRLVTVGELATVDRLVRQCQSTAVELDPCLGSLVGTIAAQLHGMLGILYRQRSLDPDARRMFHHLYLADARRLDAMDARPYDG